MRAKKRSKPHKSKAPAEFRSNPDSGGALQTSRREFLAGAIAAPLLIAALPAIADAAAGEITIASPHNRIRFYLFHDRNQLRYRITIDGREAIAASPISMSVDGFELSRDSSVDRVERYTIRESYPTRAVHSKAVNHCRGAKLALSHLPSQTNYTFEVRAYDDGVAFRHVIPSAASHVPDEATGFTIPGGSTVWFHDFEGHYEGIHQRKAIEQVKDGEWAAPPLTIKLPARAGYASITEAALTNYAGMGLRADGQRGFKAVLGHALPISHPFDLRYGKEEAKRLSRPAAIDGTITTPWRVIMSAPDLNTLVNCDLIDNLSPPPDKTIFPEGIETSWVRPGRAVWRYLDGGQNTFDGIKEFSRLAGQLGFEYNVVEGLWQRWSEAQMRELVDYSNQQNVKLWFWKHRRNLGTEKEQEDFFSLLNRMGVAGAKIDFFDHEAKEVIDLYQELLRSSARHKIMVEFHGANKPAGESRTWPNEMTREAVRGLEYRSMSLRSVHNTTLPFTRFLAGHADYTPVHFGERRRETSWAHQIASAIVFTSPLMIYGAHPQHILDNPACEFIKTIPAVWDETIVLPPSEIGEVAAFARRKGDVWFLGIMNALTGRTIRVPLSFLESRPHEAMLVRDETNEPAAVKIENASLSRRDSLLVKMRAGGGFVARFQPK